METKVIQLPKLHTWRKTWLNRFHERKASVVVSLASVLVLSLLMNQWLIDPGSDMSAHAGGRQIASVNLTLEDYRKQIQWEHAIADQIAESKKNVAYLAEKPSLKDQLLFGHLGGRYGVRYEGGRVVGFDFNAARALGAPVKISDYERFIEEYRGVWSVDFAEARLNEKTENRIVFNLLDANSSVAAKAELDLDQDGSLLNFRIIK